MSNKYKIEDNIYVKDSSKYGKSLYASRNFSVNDLVFIAFGPVVKEATTYTIPIDIDLKIDPTQPEGNFCQFICHSCDPNLGVKNRTMFVAMKEIKKDEELTIDYAMIGYEYGNEITEEEKLCKCGSLVCRGKMGCYKDLPEEIRNKYKGYISDYLLDIK